MLHIKLRRIKLIIKTLFFHQLQVCPLFHHIALIHNKDLVGILDGGEAVRNHKTGLARHQAAHCLLDTDFRASVHMVLGKQQSSTY